MAKIHWSCAPSVSVDGRNSNALVIKTLGLPEHRGSGRLAIVGGGPSITKHIEELRVWPGTVWAVNGAINWCIEHGIPAWFYTADAAPMAKWGYDLSRVRRAALAPDVSPELVEYLLAHGARVELTAPIESGPTSVNAADFLSLRAGYTQMTYFGCEGSYADDGSTHAFESFPLPDWLDVDVGKQRFRTKAEFISQSQMLSNTIRAFPEFYSERSGGLLRAMIEHGPEYDVYAVANSLFAKLSERLEEKEAAMPVDPPPLPRERHAYWGRRA